MPKRAERPTGFGGRLKALREAAGLTQSQLGERAGFHGLTVAKLEQGLQEPTWPTVLALAGALDANCLAFIPEEGEAPAESRGPGRPRKAPPPEATHSAPKGGPLPKQAPPPEPPKRGRQRKANGGGS
jgi:transcriptional regulator with XRE-family HTH domain